MYYEQLYKDHKISAFVDAGNTVATYAAFTYEQFLNSFTEEDAALLRCCVIEGKTMKLKTAGELKKYCKERLAEINKPHSTEEHQFTVDEWIKTIPNYDKE